MRILYLHQYFSTPKGSIGTRSYEMACKLVHYGHDVTMICASTKGAVTGLNNSFRKGIRRGIVDGINVIEINCIYDNKMSYIRRIFSFLKFSCYCCILVLLEKYDRVFATSTPLTIGIPGMVARWFRGKPFIFEVRDLWPEAPKAIGVLRNPFILTCASLLEWLSYHSAKRLIGLSPRMVEGIALRGIEQTRIAMIPNGCDIRLFDSILSSYRPSEIPADGFLAIYTGAHGVVNGLNSVLDAAYELKAIGNNDIYILLVGDGKLKPELIKRAHRDNLTNIIFHEPIDKLSLGALIKSADVGLQIQANIPALYFGTSPNKFFDYIANGLPVLNNYPGWVAEMIEENICGYVIPPDDPKALAKALINMSSCRDKIKEMGLNARKLAKSKFDRDKLSDQFTAWITDENL